MLSCAYLSLFLALLQLVIRKIELVLGSLSPASLYPLRAPLQWVLLLLARALALTQQVVCIMLHFFFNILILVVIIEACFLVFILA